jgi:hypothetical protein
MWMAATLGGAEREGSGVRVHYVAERGARREIDEHLHFGPRGTLAAVAAVGRVLRILRAARLRSPADPYSLAEDPERAAELLGRCRGARLRLELRRRLERHLTIWTETGVERIVRVVDFHEAANGLTIRIVGSQSTRFVPRHGLIRYAARSEEYLQVIAVETP